MVRHQQGEGEYVDDISKAVSACKFMVSLRACTSTITCVPVTRAATKNGHECTSAIITCPRIYRHWI